MMRGCDAVRELVRRLTGRDEDDLGEVKRGTHLFRDDEMPVVNRIECASQDANTPLVCIECV